MTDLDAVIDHALPQRDAPMSKREREEWGQEKPPRRPPINLGMCSGVGRETILIDGVLCCPTCTSPVRDGCNSREVNA